MKPLTHFGHLFPVSQLFHQSFAHGGLVQTTSKFFCVVFHEQIIYLMLKRSGLSIETCGTPKMFWRSLKLEPIFVFYFQWLKHATMKFIDFIHWLFSKFLDHQQKTVMSFKPFSKASMIFRYLDLNILSLFIKKSIPCLCIILS